MIRTQLPVEEDMEISIKPTVFEADLFRDAIDTMIERKDKICDKLQAYSADYAAQARYVLQELHNLRFGAVAGGPDLEVV